MKLLWGDLHNHCGISYGFGSLENALKAARVHLDFTCVTGHAMWPDMYERNPDTAFVVDFHRRGFARLLDGWQTVLDTVNAYNTPEMVTLQSYEMHHSQLGDHHIVSPDGQLPLIYRDTPAQLVRDCGCRAIAVPHHIGYTPGYRGICWDAFDESISPVVEVCSKHGCAMREGGPFAYYHDMGPLDARNTVEEGLRRGKRFGFLGSTDHHAGFPGSYGDGLTGVWAEEKTREGLWNALLKGHTYAVTGDRIACTFALNEGMMGDLIHAQRRHLHLACEGDAPVELVTIRKNGRVVAACAPDAACAPSPEGRYKLRVEMGWSSEAELFHWQGEMRVDGGRMLRVQPYLRGRSALSPSDRDADNLDATNALQNSYVMEENRACFACDTVCNKSTLHPQTSAFLVEVQADADAMITLTVNGQTHATPLRQLVQAGYTFHLKPWHSHAVKMHTACPVDACRAELEYTDGPGGEWDVYQAEVLQRNGCRAFVSPIFVQV